MESKADNLICACTSCITACTVKVHLCLNKAFENEYKIGKSPLQIVDKQLKKSFICFNLFNEKKIKENIGKVYGANHKSTNSRFLECLCWKKTSSTKDDLTYCSKSKVWQSVALLTVLLIFFMVAFVMKVSCTINIYQISDLKMHHYLFTRIALAVKLK